jgi:hypothetical protein
VAEEKELNEGEVHSGFLDPSNMVPSVRDDLLNAHSFDLDINLDHLEIKPLPSSFRRN